MPTGRSKELWFGDMPSPNWQVSRRADCFVSACDACSATDIKREHDFGVQRYCWSEGATPVYCGHLHEAPWLLSKDIDIPAPTAGWLSGAPPCTIATARTSYAHSRITSVGLSLWPRYLLVNTVERNMTQEFVCPTCGDVSGLGFDTR